MGRSPPSFSLPICDPVMCFPPAFCLDGETFLVSVPVFWASSDTACMKDSALLYRNRKIALKPI